MNICFLTKSGYDHLLIRSSPNTAQSLILFSFPFEGLTLSDFLRNQHKMDWEIGNYAFGAAAGHPFLEAVIENCVRAQKDPSWVKHMMRGLPYFLRAEYYVLNTTG